jgi:hypothetical protein
MDLQADDDVGKIAQATPVLLGVMFILWHALEQPDMMEVSMLRETSIPAQ